MDSTRVVDQGSLDGKYRRYVPLPSRVASLKVEGDTATIVAPDATGMKLREISVLCDGTDGTQEPTVGLETAALEAPIVAVDRFNPQSFLVSDGDGNVNLLTMESDEQPVKRSRRETGATVLLSAADSAPMPGAFSVCGSPGSAAIAKAPGSTLAAVTREFYKDIRVFDVAAPRVVSRSFYPIHFPRALSQIDNSTFVVAEGPLVSLWDVRARDACVSRVTTLQQTTDVVSLGNNQVAASGDARTVIIYDTRKWNRVASSQSITKYATNGLVHLGGDAFVVSGEDSEAKVILCGDKTKQPKEEADETGESFRTRFANNINAEHRWYCKWVGDGRCAAGLSDTGEVMVYRHQQNS